MNETIQTQLNHRTIRAFKDQALTKEEVDLLVEVAQRTASSMYIQAYSIISVTDPELKKALATVSGQPYVATSGHLFVFVVDQRRNTEIAKALGQEVGVQGSADRFVSGVLFDGNLGTLTVSVNGLELSCQVRLDGEYKARLRRHESIQP